ncbi:hypothetical protein QVD17_10257 [Tagetes erecta]|uniref:Uncharacterized protein n=1 Tax=Tagetes erecta TaxID=13708 RepID=A0AAD8L7J9_TARER|nr:hypothetical protein QVD17_10257 [Tagetes erecta]
MSHNFYRNKVDSKTQPSRNHQSVPGPSIVDLQLHLLAVAAGLQCLMRFVFSINFVTSAAKQHFYQTS